MPQTELDRLLEDTVPPPHMRRRASDRRSSATPPIIAQFREEQRAQRGGVFRRWAKSQIAGYRLELIFRYLALMGFGTTAIRAGIPVFTLSSPDPYAWAVGVGTSMVIGGLVAAIGAIRAGEEPQTRMIRIFNRIETVGTALLFITLGGYAVVLMLYGFYYGDLGRQTIGSAMTALAVGPTVRMVWLIFRPGKIKDSGLGKKIQSMIGE